MAANPCPSIVNAAGLVDLLPPEYEAYLKRKDPRKLDGIDTVRWQNGNLRQRMTSKNGLLHGTFTEWDKAGNVVGREV